MRKRKIKRKTADFSLAKVEKRMILAALEHAGGHKIRAAKLLGVSKNTLYRRLEQYRHARRKR